MKHISGFFFLLFILASCTSELKPSEIVQFVKDPENGFISKREIARIALSAMYKPVPYIIFNQLRTNEVTEKEYEAQVSDYGKMIYFDLSINTDKNLAQDILYYNAYSEEDYNKRLTYFTFGFQKDIFLLVNNDTIPCELFNFERTYDLKNEKCFELGFDIGKRNLENDFTLFVNSDFVGVGPVNLNFQTNKIKTLPKPKFVGYAQK